MKTFTFASALLLAALPMLSCSQTRRAVLHTDTRSAPSGRAVVRLNAAQEKEWSTFLSNFSEVSLKPFKRGSLTDQDLIAFGLAHNETSNKKLFRNISGGENKRDTWILDSHFVAEAAAKYFGQEIKRQQSTHRAQYSADSRYAITVSSPLDDGRVGEAFSFSHIKRLVSLGNDVFAADADVYTAGGNWDLHTTSDPGFWKDSVDYDAPTLDYSVRATVQKVTTGTQSHLILLDYQRIPTSMTPRIQGRRWIHTLRDGAGKTYTCFLCANDESRRKQESFGQNFNTGDIAYTGHYRVGMIAPGQKTAIDQQLPHFTGAEKFPEAFNLKRNEVYVVRGQVPAQPDLFVCEQWESSSVYAGYVCFVQNGRLRQVQFKIPGQTAVPYGEWFPNNFWSVGPYTYMSAQHSNVEDSPNWHRETWHFNPATQTMTRIKTVRSYYGRDKSKGAPTK